MADDFPFDYDDNTEPNSPYPIPNAPPLAPFDTSIFGVMPIPAAPLYLMNPPPTEIPVAETFSTPPSMRGVDPGRHDIPWYVQEYADTISRLPDDPSLTELGYRADMFSIPPVFNDEFGPAPAPIPVTPTPPGPEVEISLPIETLSE